MQFKIHPQYHFKAPLMQHHEWNTHNCSLRCSHSCFSSSHRSYCSHNRMTAMVQSPKRNHSSMNPLGSACSAFCNMPRARGTAISLLGCRKKESGSDVSWKHEVDQWILLQLRRVSVVAHGSEGDYCSHSRLLWSSGFGSSLSQSLTRSQHPRHYHNTLVFEVLAYAQVSSKLAQDGISIFDGLSTGEQ